MTRQGQAVQSRLLRKRAVAIVSEQHVRSDSHRDIDVVKAIRIDVGHRDALLLVRGDRRKIRMGRRLHALAVKVHGGFVVLGAPQLRDVLGRTEGCVQRLDEQPRRAGVVLHFLGLPACDLPVRRRLAGRCFRSLPAHFHFAVQRTPLAGLHHRQGLEAAPSLRSGARRHSGAPR